MILGRYPCRHARLQSGDGSEPERASIGPIAIRPAQRGPVAVYREPKIVEVNPAGGICGLPGREVSTPAADMPAVGAEVRHTRGGMPEAHLLGLHRQLRLTSTRRDASFWQGGRWMGLTPGQFKVMAATVSMRGAAARWWRGGGTEFQARYTRARESIHIEHNPSHGVRIALCRGA